MDIGKSIDAVIKYLGEYNFLQILILIIVVPLVTTVCLKIMKPKKIGIAEFYVETKPKRKLFRKKVAK